MAATLKYYRQRAALSMQELADLAGVTQATVFKAEHGRGIRPSTHRKLAAAFGIEPHELLVGQTAQLPHRPVARSGLGELIASVERAGSERSGLD